MRNNIQEENNDLAIPRSSNTLGNKSDRQKRKKVKMLISDFSPFLPDSLIIVNKTSIPSKIRLGNRYQAFVERQPAFKSIYRPIDNWRIWRGSSSPEHSPSEEHLMRFKDLLGDNRN